MKLTMHIKKKHIKNLADKLGLTIDETIERVVITGLNALDESGDVRKIGF